MDYIKMLLNFLEAEVNRENNSYLNLVNVQGHISNWWTGGNDLGREDSWSWVNSQKTVGDFVWRDGQPNEGIRANCLALYFGGSYEGDDWDCRNVFYPICQINI